MVASTYIQEIEAWRAEMDAQLRAPGPWGWLAVAGTYPLEKGKNTIGSSRKSTIRLPKSAPEGVGQIEFDGQHGKLRVTTRQPVFVDGVEVRTAQLRNHREKGGMSVVRVGNITFGIAESINRVYEVIVWDADSPRRQSFPLRAWYPINPDYCFTGRFIRNYSANELIKKSPNQYTPELMHLGNVFVYHAETRYRYAVMRSDLGPKYLWLMLYDKTNGKTTHERGRHLQVRIIDGEEVEVDFNKLVMPPMTFCEHIVSPMAPIPNLFMTPLEVGERYPE